ncbi:hypothetical protein EVAR_65136_1 [Eumeta japonica]|uniref:Uncharacterized protein n=1 Tax=Eumeta variegata TaxID=151549 RepID=A0A4C1Z728_EUMVA|nr:hypothetical protein EVAR_65136_1 [Eumeta japonica]
MYEYIESKSGNFFVYKNSSRKYCPPDTDSRLLKQKENVQNKFAPTLSAGALGGLDTPSADVRRHHPLPIASHFHVTCGRAAHSCTRIVTDTRYERDGMSFFTRTYVRSPTDLAVHVLEDVFTALEICDADSAVEIVKGSCIKV